VLELEGGRSLFFAGPWHAWRREKAERAQHAAKTAARVSEDIARLERFVARFRYKKSKAKQAQAKLTQIYTKNDGRQKLHLRGQRRSAQTDAAFDAHRSWCSVRDDRAGPHLLQPDATAVQVRAKNDHGSPPAGASAHRAAAHCVLR